MTKRLFKGTTNGLELWVDEQVLENLRQEREDRRKRQLEKGGQIRSPLRHPEKIVQSFVDNLKVAGQCWEWMKCRMSFGHGQCGVYGKLLLVHRFAYELLVDQIPPNQLVCHHCDNPPCCNPNHLFAGTRQDNVDDAVSKGRHIKGEMVGGHKLTEPQVLELRKRYAVERISFEKLAKEFGIGTMTAYWAIKGITWKHIPLLTGTT